MSKSKILSMPPSVYLAIIALIILIPVAYAGYIYAPWVPTRKKDLRRVLELADMQKGQLFYELGCGDARVTTYIAKNTEANVIGIEIAYPLYIIGTIRAFFSGVDKKRHTLKLRNFFKENLSQADVVYTYGMPKHLANKLKKKLEKELKKGTKIISYIFPIEGWEPKEKNRPTEKDVGIYVYIQD